jgi:N-acetylated-alpha-linked acidic dipeptidase
LNKTLIATERALIRPEGLPNRPWYKHQIYAPGFYTGYGVKTLPGIREAVDAGQWQAAAQQATRVAECLAAMNQLIVKAAEQAGGI